MKFSTCQLDVKAGAWTVSPSMSERELLLFERLCIFGVQDYPCSVLSVRSQLDIER